MKTIDVDVKIHLIDSDLDANFMQKRANVLKESQPKSAHILVNGNTLVVALNGTEIKTETANSVSLLYTNDANYLCTLLDLETDAEAYQGRWRRSKRNGSRSFIRVYNN
jgi:LEA14-like dessication related protein